MEDEKLELEEGKRTRKGQHQNTKSNIGLQPPSVYNYNTFLYFFHFHTILLHSRRMRQASWRIKY